MKRSYFLLCCLSTFSLLSSPFILLAEAAKNFRVKEGFKVDAGKDRNSKSIELFEGDSFDCKISSNDTDGDIYVFESKRIKEGGPSHHYHFAQDEWCYVLQGEFIIKVGDVMHKVKAGTVYLDQE